MRYFAKLSYKGTAYCGWQKQPSSPSVQETIEKALFTILRKEIDIIGCGRTDTGVHASQYYIHFDVENPLTPEFISRINKVLPQDISFHELREVEKDAHARFDAVKRSYTYHLVYGKDPFKKETAYCYYLPQKPDFNLMQEAASILLEYKSFYTFCKTRTDVKTMDCKITIATWTQVTDNHWTFHIEANRFLRGMVRLIVGMCINVGIGKVSIDEVRAALEKQERLERGYSVPAEGLFLDGVFY